MGCISVSVVLVCLLLYLQVSVVYRDDVLFDVVGVFQAEDGIRDLVRSRGLGDVYKRQIDPDRDHWR